MSRSWVIGTVVVVALVVGAGLVTMNLLKAKPGAPEAGGFEPAEAAELVAAKEIPWQATADLVGTVIAMRSVLVRNELSGVVREVGFQSGDIVEQGQVILRQDDTTERADLEAVKAAVRVAEANIAQADSQIKLAEAELARFTGVQSRAIAEVDLDRARTKLDTTRADRGRWVAEVDQAKARVAQVEARLAKMSIKAPFRARAGLRTVHEGQYLAEGADVVALQELTDDIYLDFAIPQEYAPRVKPGTTVMAKADMLGAEPVKITVVASDAIVNNQTRNLRVRALVKNPGGVLVPGMSVQVRVPIDAPKTLVAVPTTAVRRAAYGNSVFLISPDEKGEGMRARQKFVSLGETVGEQVIVLDGLKVGDRIAAAGSFKLRDGVKVLEGPPGGAPGGPPGASGPSGPGGATGPAGASGPGPEASTKAATGGG
ncbi:MAG: efflux RND transporter periplasmic adaptor subunit [Phycisphaerales bacterium]